ncbi:ComF family protein [Paenirhodobacter populi]|nr:ComF family protein [Sinirhodobacter populi]
MMGTEITALRARIPALLRGLALGGLHSVFPPRCICCGGAVASDFGLCGDCWRETAFIAGLACDVCGAPLPGEAGEATLCDECLTHPRPWDRAAAAIRYDGAGRRLVLALKHGDRLDLARPLGGWVARAAAPLIEPGMIVAPIPLHRLRLLKRQYNQSALLSRVVAHTHGLRHVPDLFQRLRATPSQEGRSRTERHENLADALRVTPRRAAALKGHPVLIVDDVMTSGATFGAATEAALSAGATKVHVVALARVAKDA